MGPGIQFPTLESWGRSSEWAGHRLLSVGVELCFLEQGAGLLNPGPRLRFLEHGAELLSPGAGLRVLEHGAELLSGAGGGAQNVDASGGSSNHGSAWRLWACRGGGDSRNWTPTRT
jgi:hypothetical protein